VRVKHLPKRGFFTALAWDENYEAAHRNICIEWPHRTHIMYAGTVSQRCESSIRSTSPQPAKRIHRCVCSALVNYNTHAAAAHMTPYGIVKCVYLACRKNSDKRVNARSISTCRAGIFIWWAAAAGQWQKKLSKLEQHCWVPRTLAHMLYVHDGDAHAHSPRMLFSELIYWAATGFNLIWLWWLHSPPECESTHGWGICTWVARKQLLPAQDLNGNNIAFSQ
jgi:hypothetical protein